MTQENPSPVIVWLNEDGSELSPTETCPIAKSPTKTKLKSEKRITKANLSTPLSTTGKETDASVTPAILIISDDSVNCEKSLPSFSARNKTQIPRGAAKLLKFTQAKYPPKRRSNENLSEARIPEKSAANPQTDVPCSSGPHDVPIYYSIVGDKAFSSKCRQLDAPVSRRTRSAENLNQRWETAASNFEELGSYFNAAAQLRPFHEHQDKTIRTLQMDICYDQNSNKWLFNGNRCDAEFRKASDIHTVYKVPPPVSLTADNKKPIVIDDADIEYITVSSSDDE